MKSISLVFGTTNTQPVGATDREIEEVYQRSYKPFLRTLYAATKLPVTLHHTGHLLQWLEKRHSEYTDVLAEMAERKQVEMLGGGFYDPILSLIPRPDRIGQIESLTTLLRKRFGRRPRGAWITEHVWETGLASVLRASGIDYALLDDRHFSAAGLSGEDLQQPCITEDQGKTIIVFPVGHDLASVAQNGSPDDVIAFLSDRATTGSDSVCALVDSGERGGISKWMARFVGLLQENGAWIHVCHPSQYLRDAVVRTRGYFPWGPREQALYQTLSRYPESNLMYAKMQYTHVLVNQIRGDKYRKQAAREELWRGQCHTAYWSGGIYRNGLRKNVYQALIEAEKKTRERGIFSPSVVTLDYDMDGLEEYLYQGQDLNAYIHQEGGMLFELDYLPKPWNYLDTLRRQKESYHTAKDAARGYDLQMRKSYMDRFFDEKTTVKDFARSTKSDLGNLVSCLYKRTAYRREGQRLVLQGDGAIRVGRRRRNVSVEKCFFFKRGMIQVDYTLTNVGDGDLSCVFGPEFNFAFLSQEADALRIFARHGRGPRAEISPAPGTHPRVSEVRMHDLANKMVVSLILSAPATVWCLSVETASDSSGAPPDYQSTCVVPRWPMNLSGGESFGVTATIRFDRG